MSEISRFNPMGRFTGLAEIYARCRPGYPDAAIEFIATQCGLKPGSLMVDVGAGTGIASRLFAERGVRVVGVEPNPNMRAEAEATDMPAGVPRPTYVAGRGEATGLESASADVVLAAQAFHWFEADAALAEFHRILKPAGWVVLMWNDHDAADPFTKAFDELILALPDAAAAELLRCPAGEVLFGSALFDRVECRRFPNEQILDEEGFIGRAFSASYAPREVAAAKSYEAALRRLFTQYENRGQVALRYSTAVYVGRAVSD